MEATGSKNNDVVIQGTPRKVTVTNNGKSERGYAFDINGQTYACRQDDYDAFKNYEIKANKNVKSWWTVTGKNGKVIALIKPSIVDDVRYSTRKYR